MSYETMVAEFKTPTDANHLWCYWDWINDDISKDGITKDLAAMKEVGIGTALIANINPPEKDGKVPLFSEEWRECMVHAVMEGKRLGVDIGFFNCPGWSQSGGPWVKPEMAMRYLVYSETTLQGPGKISRKLLQPRDEFQDVCVLAFPAVVSEFKKLTKDNAAIRVTPEVQDAQHWIDGDYSSAALLDQKKTKEYTIEIQTESPITARSIILYPINQKLKVQCKLYAHINNNDRLIKSFLFDRSNLNTNVGPIANGPVAIALPETKATLFKLVCSDIRGADSGFAEIEITEKAVLEKYIEKQLGKMHSGSRLKWDSYLWEEQPSVPNDQILPVKNSIDISDKMDKDGILKWQVPAGKWTVMRIGMAPTGVKNAPAAPQGKGYEIDKANEALVRYHFEQFIGKRLKEIPPESRSALKYVVADSYETGSQNWTDKFEKRFKKRYGYNPKTYLPVLSGIIVGSVTESERFLWDLRRTVADDVAWEYAGGLRKICNEHNLLLWLENYGHWGFPSEFLMYGGQADLVSGEFWDIGDLGNIECKAASSCAHTYGKSLCFAEAFTSSSPSYTSHPAKLKKRGDLGFTEGINLYVLQVYIHQPDDAKVPGMNAWFGPEFNRHNTWFRQSRHWLDYLRRCQYLLQQGNYVADVCYFIGEDAPKMTGIRSPELPEGYSYDYINAEVILRDLQVQDGRLVLPGKAAYRLMVLPPQQTMRPALVAKLEKLVQQGGAIYGPKPLRSPSLQDYPKCDRQVQTIAGRLWGANYFGGDLNRKYGQGYIFNGLKLQEVLDTLNVDKDCSIADKSVLWTHRTMPGMDIYFLTNQSDRKIEIQPEFRITGLKPQLWDAVTGEVRLLPNYNQTPKGTIIPITLEPAQSLFVVFSNDSAAGVQAGYSENFPTRRILSTVVGPWTVNFDNSIIDVHEKMIFENLTDWSSNENEAIKYYSGTAVYTAEFTLDPIPQGKDIFINLGEVHVMAEVSINGQPAGGTWIYPHVLNVTNLVQAGKNTLKIDVVNPWRNYLIKDQNLPEDQRRAWLTTREKLDKDEAPHPAGLIGPVVLETLDKKE